MNKILAIVFVVAVSVMGVIVTTEAIKISKPVGWTVGGLMAIAIVAMYEQAKYIWGCK